MRAFCTALATFLGGCGCPSKDVEPARVALAELLGADIAAKPAPRVHTSQGGCASGRMWTEDEEGSEDMLPGSACLDCHGEDDEPAFAVAGTVYPFYGERDDCYGLAGVTVRIIDAKKRTFNLKTTESGNFTLLLEDAPDLAFPIGAEVHTPDGLVAPKVTPLHDGDCNRCHTNEATPGRQRGRVIAHPDAVDGLLER